MVSYIDTGFLRTKNMTTRAKPSTSMKYLKIACFIFVIMACNVQVFAAAWDYVNESKDYKYYIDVTSVKSEGGIVSAWMKEVLKKKAKPYTVSGQTVHESKFKFQALESSDKIRVVDTVYYNSRGEVIRRLDGQYSAFIEPVPETIGEIWLLNLYVWQVMRSDSSKNQPLGAIEEPAAPLPND